MSETENLAIARRYVAALSRGAGADEIGQLYALAAVQEEFPNRLLPTGATRDLEALKQARIRGQALLNAEQFDLLGAVSRGDQVAMELRWTGTIGAGAGPFEAGQTLRAQLVGSTGTRETSSCVRTTGSSEARPSASRRS